MNPDFRRYLASRFCSGAATMMLRAAVAWHVFELTDSAFHLGMLGLVQFLPAPVLMLVGGAVADSYDRRRVMLCAQSALLACGVALFALTWRDEVNVALEETKNNTGLTLVLALNYGSRAEITDAVRAIASKVRSGELDPEDVDEAVISDHLYTAGMPDPDLLIRTAGEMRVSNYLLWQISYAELVVSDVLWPDYEVQDLHAAIRAFASRNRRFGALDHTNTLVKSKARAHG